jgi:hypothetical protein
MKKSFLIGLVLLVNISGYSQTQFNHSDSVDQVALNYFNMYRAYHNLPNVVLDESLKSTCISWAKTTSDSCGVKVGHSKSTLPYGELVTGALFQSCSISDTVSKFALFVKVITNKKIKELTGVDVVILQTLYSWDQSSGHKVWMVNKNVKKIYYALYYMVNRPTLLKYANKNDEMSKNPWGWGYSDRGEQLRFGYGSVIQFRQ